MNFRKNLHTPNVGFQIAPLLDILLTLLIFFMVTSVSVRRETRMDLTVPTSDTSVPAVRSVGEVIINIDPVGKVFLRNVEQSLPELEKKLRLVSNAFRDQPVIIRADAKTPHEKVVAVLDVCRKVDIWNISFATLPGMGGE